MPRVPASYLRSGDHVRVGSYNSPIGEYLATQNSLHRKARQLYFGRIGCVTQPRTDKRDEYFVRADVLESGFGIRALHLPNSAVRDYFYFFRPRADETPQPTLYEALRTPRSATPADLRLSYRIRRIELETGDAANSEMQRIERAFNLLAHPELRSCYDALLQDSGAPALFPYGGFGQCVVSGELAQGGKTFFVQQLLSYLPDQRQRQFRAPLRRIEYFNGYALYRDSRRKAEVYLDPTILPVGWDPTWNQWRHLVGSKIGISGTFVHAGKYRRTSGEWHLVQWETALPSRLSVTMPSDATRSFAAARRSYQRLGEYHDAIERVRVLLAREALDQRELADLCRSLGIPPDFDVAQFCWKPDYDPYFYQELKKRSRNIYFLRDEYIFQLSRAIVAEVPQLGHATYVFAEPTEVREFVRRYATTGRDDIRKNRGNVAHQLGFIGRVMHGNDPRTWLRELRTRIGEGVDYAHSIG
ncbi:MAG: hypothetical protein U0Q18_32705 [Bryobacteraceae bacterium]